MELIKEDFLMKLIRKRTMKKTQHPAWFKPATSRSWRVGLYRCAAATGSGTYGWWGRRPQPSSCWSSSSRPHPPLPPQIPLSSRSCTGMNKYASLSPLVCWEAVEQWLAYSLATQVARVRILPSINRQNTIALTFYPFWHQMVGWNEVKPS